MRPIELLSPAKNIECGLAAINHGADAVYIGAPMFGARAAAGNTIQDIEELATYAHKFNSRIYAAVNTILSDTDLELARKQIWDLYHAGADAVIIQDMGILQMDLPPIALHASTQTDNRSAEKVQFLEKAGFSQVVLARELNLEQIKLIASQTTVPLEFFVHGALCVSYSGQCYISEAFTGRSANKGECAQYCRLPYNLVDANGELLMRNKHLLSLKDLNLSEHLSELLEAGVSSFKIEGRLKEADYVKNITAFYRQKLDAAIEGSSSYKKSSSGNTTFFFTPNPEKSFHRGSSAYFVKGRTAEIVSFETPKSVGEYIGKVQDVGRNYLYIETDKELHNGDGLCFLNRQNDFSGFRVNRAEGKRVFPAEMPNLKEGTIVYRNYDIDFDKLMGKKSSERKIELTIHFSELPEGFNLQLTDEDENQVNFVCIAPKEAANQAEKALETIRTQLAKLGTTDFVATDITLDLADAYFIPGSHLAEWRREAVEQLEALRKEIYSFERKTIAPTTHPYPVTTLSYLGNVHNKLAEAFYRQHGVTQVDPSFEKQPVEGATLMFTRHCLKFSLGACPRFSPKPLVTIIEPLTLEHKDTILALDFDCVKCEMLVKDYKRVE